MAARNPNEVGSPGHPATDGGRQTPQQAAVTRQDGGGRDDSSRNADWAKEGDTADRRGPGLGGSSQGESDRKTSGTR